MILIAALIAQKNRRPLTLRDQQIRRAVIVAAVQPERSAVFMAPDIVGIKISGAKYVFNPDPELTLSRGDQLFVLGSPIQIKEFRNLLESQK